MTNTISALASLALAFALAGCPGNTGPADAGDAQAIDVPGDVARDAVDAATDIAASPDVADDAAQDAPAGDDVVTPADAPVDVPAAPDVVDAAADAPAADVMLACNGVGAACGDTMTCAAGQQCYTGGAGNFCGTDRPICGGFANARCPGAAPFCLRLLGTDYGACTTAPERDCICANAGAAVQRGEEGCP